MKKYVFMAIGIVLLVGLVVLSRIEVSEPEASVYDIYNIQGLSVAGMIESLDEQILDPDIISAAVLERELVIISEQGKDTYAIDEGLFYLSFAPYITSTHPCHNHNLVTCRGELANETVAVYIEASDGTVLFDDTVTLYENGFKGIWLPFGLTAQMTVTYNGLTAETAITTFEDSGTCLTEPLKLS